MYAQLARGYAQLGDRNRTMQYIQLAEKEGPSSVYISTGEALSILGEEKAALARFERALSAPDSDRVEVRLAIAKLMIAKGETDDTRRQVTLALMEAAAGRTAPRPPSSCCERPTFSSVCTITNWPRRTSSARSPQAHLKLTSASAWPIPISLWAIRRERKHSSISSARGWEARSRAINI